MKTSSCLATASLALLLAAGAARADIQIHGSTTAYTTTDKDWLSHTAEDIDANGLGTDGWLFFGNFDGTPVSDQPLSHRIESLPPYITGIVAGANFLSVSDEYDTESPGFGIIDDPTTLSGSDARSGAVVADGGVAGDSLEILSFTVSGLSTRVRVGILSGTEQRADGRWDPTSITLSDGIHSATVGDHATSPLPFVPDSVTPNNVGWVFFDIDANGTYTISATKRLATQGVSIGGLTFDTAARQPLLHWPLEESSGTTTTETISGATDIATLIEGPTRVAGFAPGSTQAIDFQITTPGSYVDAGTLQTDGQYAANDSATDSRVLNGQWTIAGWIEIPEGSSGGDRCIITSERNYPSSSWLCFIGSAFGKSNNLGFDFSSERIYSDLDVPTGRPVFVAVSADPAAIGVFGAVNRHRFAIWDGVTWSYAEGTQYSGVLLKGLEIGSWDSGQRQFKGAIDEIRIYDKALSKEDLAALALQNAIGVGLGGMVSSPSVLTDPTDAIFTVQFTEEVSGFDVSDLVISCDPPGSLIWGTPVITGSGSLYQVRVPIQGDRWQGGGTLMLDLRTGSGIQNLAGEPLATQSGGSAIIELTPPALLLHWALEESAGSTTTESVSAASDIATLIEGPTRVTGLAPFSAGALDFQITTPGSYVDAGTLQSDGQYAAKDSATDSRVLDEQWTMAGWVEIPEGTSGSDRCILSSDNDLSNAWLFFTGSAFGRSNNLGFDFGNIRAYSDLEVPTGRPVFVAVSADPAASAFGTGNKHRFAIWDGLTWSYAEGTTYSAARLKGLEIGSWNSGQQQFKGAIDEVRIYDWALSKEDLTALAFQNAIGAGLGGWVSSPTGVITSSSSADFTVQFTEEVSGFDVSDLVISCDPPGSLVCGTPVITGAGSLYQVSVPIQGAGTLLLDLQTGAGIQNLAGDPLATQFGGSAIVDLLPPAPLLHWAFEESAGSTTTESVSAASDIATLIEGPTRVAGFAPFSTGALDFQITTPGSYVDAGTLQTDGQYAAKDSATDSRVLDGKWTIAGWVEIPEGTSGRDRCILTSDNDLSNAWLFFIDSFHGRSNNLAFDFGVTRAYTDLELPTGRPVFVAVSADPSASAFGAGNKHRFAIWDGLTWSYVEGTAYAAARLKGLEIGSWNSGQRQFKGAIDEVRIYDKALSKEDLTALALQNTIGAGLGGWVSSPGVLTDPTDAIFAVHFTEEVSGFGVSDLVISCDPPGSLVCGTPVITGSGSTYQVSVPVQGEGTLLLDLQTGPGIQNLAGEPLATQSGGSIMVIAQSSPLVVSITPATTGPVTSGSKVAFTVVFSEPVQNFISTDLDTTGSGPGIVNLSAIATTDGVTYVCEGELDVPDGEASGLLRMTVRLGTAITDLVGNPLIGPVPTSADVIYSATDYQLWAIGKGLTPGVNFSYDLDADSDGRLNGEEFVRDAEPLVAGDPVKQRIHFVDQPGGSYGVFTIVAPDTAVYLKFSPATAVSEVSISSSVLLYDIIQSSWDLIRWGPGPSYVEDPTVATPPGMPDLSPGWSYRHFRFTDPVTTLPKAFMRNETTDSP